MISSDDRRKLSELEQLLVQAEGLRTEAPLRDSDLARLRSALESFAACERVELSKLAQLTRHLKPDISPRTLQDLRVPIERALRRSVQDEDFLIRREDAAVSKSENLPLIFVLDHLRSAFNVGSLFRTAEGLGVEKIYLTGYTPSPDEAKTARAALGSETRVPWECRESTPDLLRELKSQGVHLIALETADRATKLTEAFPHRRTALVLGNERFGLEADVLALCDELRELPLAGVKNSLNVAVFGAIAAFEWKRQWRS